MDISDKTKMYLDMLEEKFNKEQFYDFIKDLLNLEEKDIVDGKEQKAGSEIYQNYIETAKLYAKYEDKNRKNIGVMIIKLKDNKHPANARTLQRNFIAHLLEHYSLDASLAVVYGENDDTWRLSFVKQELQIEVGKLKTTVTPAKRYSYLFGKDEPNHTAKEQLLELLENNSKKYSIEEIEEKFSVEKVTKDFFEKYKENYLKLKETLDNNEEFISEANRCDFTSEEFTKKLMGQIVFIYFLQKKGWLGVKLVPHKLTLEEYSSIYNNQDILGKKVLDKYYINYDGNKIIKKELLEKFKENEDELESLSSIFVNTKYDQKWGTGEKKFIRAIFNNCKNRNKNFFDDYLEPFFYNGLNHKRENQYFSVFNCKVPFLNGGLFEPLDNYKWEIARFNIEDNIFSNSEGTGILDFFDRYNFTMNEEEPLEKDIAVDPEMLGKIFENLLDVKDRKSKGAFYTPREIVHYMCQESLANFLVNKVNVDYTEIKDFIQYGEMIRDIDLKQATIEVHLLGDSVFKNIIKIDNELENIKIADPAVGSGAFPLGMLNEIVKIRDILTSYMLLYNKLGLFNKKYSEEEICSNKRSIYNIKWNTIKNSIYAVDIENSAVDITKLRLWLSIVVDQIEVPEKGPEPLPNLDCKIMQGNSLIDEYEGTKLIDEKFIDELKDRDNVRFNDGGIIKERKKKIEIEGNQIGMGDGQKKAQIDDLIRLKQDLYETNEPSRKKDILNRIQLARKELLKLNFIGTNKEKELFEIDKSHNKPYFAWMLEFIEVFIENDGFDIVIGNPPYVKIQNINEAQTILLKKNYKSSTGKFDLYVLFIEKSFLLLNYKGNCSYIQPHRFLKVNYGKGIRKFLKDKKGLSKVISFGTNQVFDSATTYTGIFFYSKDNKKIKYAEPKTNNLALLDFKGINWEDLDDSWNLEYKNSDNIVNKINQCSINLLDIFEGIYQGIITLGDDKFIMEGYIKDEKFYGFSKELKKEIVIEADILRPVLKGENIRRYSQPKSNKFVIYPHKLNEKNRTIPMEEDELKINYPLAYDYLLNFKKELIEKKIKYKTNSKYWYSLHRAREKKILDSNKIITPQLQNYCNFAFDLKSMYPDAGGYMLLIKEKYIAELYYYFGILNSSIFYHFIKKTSTAFNNDYYYFKTDYIKKFKFPDNVDNLVKLEIINLVSKIVDARNVNNEVDTSEYEKKIDEIVYKIYGINSDEIENIEVKYNVK